MSHSLKSLYLVFIIYNIDFLDSVTYVILCKISAQYQLSGFLEYKIKICFPDIALISQESVGYSLDIQALGISCSGYIHLVDVSTIYVT